MFQRMRVSPELSRIMNDPADANEPAPPPTNVGRTGSNDLQAATSNTSTRRRLEQPLVIAGALFTGTVLGAVLYAYAPDLIRTESAQPPVNFVEVSDQLDTSGQPSEAQLGGLRGRGYSLVVNLAPPTTIGSIPHEGMLVAREGLSYVNIPVDWHSPRYEDFVLFSHLLLQAGPRHVLVHCQVNKRASLFTFLYRVIHEGVAPDVAYEKVSAVWIPDAQWKEFARATLKRHKIDFDLY
jgi:protein tyrosine phosphatase (PTP) superfamily phosphohydrolase (DUF442 family)